MVGSKEAAGLDLISPQSHVIPSKSKLLISLDIAIKLSKGTYGRIAPRSGLASKHFIDVGAGVIDPDYNGCLKVLLFNFGETDFEIKR